MNTMGGPPWKHKGLLLPPYNTCDTHGFEKHAHIQVWSGELGKKTTAEGVNRLCLEIDTAAETI